MPDEPLTPFGFNFVRDRAWSNWLWNGFSHGTGPAPYDADGTTFIEPVLRGCSLDLYANDYTKVVRPSIVNGPHPAIHDLADLGVFELVEPGPIRVAMPFPGKPGDRLPAPGKYIKDVLITFDAPEPPAGFHLALRRQLEPPSPGKAGSIIRQPCSPVRVRVRIGGQMWRVYWDEQAADAIVPWLNDVAPVTGLARNGAPTPGRTNAHWAEATNTRWRPRPTNPAEPEFQTMGPDGWHLCCVGGAVMPAEAESVGWLTGGKATREG